MEVLQDTYKDTKVGRIPKDWRVLKFRDIFNFIITSSHSKNEMVYSETDTEIYNVHYGAIHTTYKEQILDFEKYDIPRITDDSKLPREDQFLIDGDLVIVDASEDWGGMGECVELKNLEGRKVIGGLHTYAVRDKINAFAKGFTGYIFQNTAVRNKLASYANVSKVYGITKGNISNVPIVIPTLPEQQKIAAILSTVDEQISTTDKIIEKSKELKKGLMQKLFSEGIGHTEFKDTKIGLNLEILNGFPAKSKYFNNERNGLPLIRIRNILKGHSETYYSGEFDSKYLIKKGDILIGMDGDFNIAKWTGVPSILNQRICKLIAAKDPFNLEYLYYYLEVELKKIQARTPSTTVKHLSIKDLRKVNAYCPPLSEQQKIADILSEADAKIEKEQTQKTQLETLKKGLMQQLLTGKKRVKV
tara:strand:- start:579 stop:1829 length:1251 start_codon:yes stop_codon:yes gene_type:complete